MGQLVVASTPEPFARKFLVVGDGWFGWTFERALATVFADHGAAAAAVNGAVSYAAPGGNPDYAQWSIIDLPRHPDIDTRCWWKIPGCRSPADTHKRRMLGWPHPHSHTHKARMRAEHGRGG